MTTTGRVRVHSQVEKSSSLDETHSDGTNGVDETAPATRSRRHAVRIVHYNDVYNIEEGQCEPVGGAARFVTAIRRVTNDSPVDTLVLFSGDAFSPAPLTPITMGAEMPPVLNATNIDVACIGSFLQRTVEVTRVEAKLNLSAL